MSFFKEFKEDLSKAVDELLPKDDAAEYDAEDPMVNTLDEDAIDEDNSSENERMREWLEGFAQENDNDDDDIADNNETLDDIIDDTELVADDDQETQEATPHTALEAEYEENMEEEDNNMDDNIDIELLEALNADEEEKEQVEEKKEPRLRATSVVSDDDVTVITKGTTINGSISSDGSLDVMGTITGDIECLGKLSITGKVVGNSTASEIYVNTDRLEGNLISEGSIKVGLGTVIIGDVTATSGVIAGAIKGEIDINGPVVVDSTSIIKGNIKAKSVQINNGAVIEGFCSLSYSDVDVDNIFEK